MRIETFEFERPCIMGVLNVTPDSFSDGGRYEDVDAAVAAARRMAAEGADVIDVGGESTRPGAQRVAAAEQLRRVAPVIERLAGQSRRAGTAISIDTTRAEVAEAALEAGACIVNDVSAGRDDERMFALVAERGAALVLMHMRGRPETMQRDPRYVDVVEEVRSFLLERAAAAERAGVPPQRIAIDPGIGFGKTTEHNLRLLAKLGRFVETGYAVMVGASRKRFLGELTGATEPSGRVAATAATTALAVAAGVRMIRVHDVAANRQAADVAWAVKSEGRGQRSGVSE